jgi:hypothetical protein
MDNVQPVKITVGRRETGSDQRGLLQQERTVPSLPLDPTGAPGSHTMTLRSTEELP